MTNNPGDQLKSLYGLTGILTMAPQQGGITELLCDMDECFCPRGRASFDRIPNPMPKPIPDWIPSEEHFPRSQEADGLRDPGNVRLGHRRCNCDDWGIGSGHELKRKRARNERATWLEQHPVEAAANAEAFADAEERWAAMRHVTTVPHLERVVGHLVSDGVVLGAGYWLYACRVLVAAELSVCVGWAEVTPAGVGHVDDLPWPLLESRRGEWSAGNQLVAAGIDPAACVIEAVAVGPVVGPPLEGDLVDELDAQETALAGLLCTRSYRVIGSQPGPRVYDRGLFERIREFIEPEFPWVLRPLRHLGHVRLESVPGDVPSA